MFFGHFVTGKHRGLASIILSLTTSWRIRVGSHLLTCPNHLNLPPCMASGIGLMWKSLNRSEFLISPFRVTHCISRRDFMAAVVTQDSCPWNDVGIGQ